MPDPAPDTDRDASTRALMRAVAVLAYSMSRTQTHARIASRAGAGLEGLERADVALLRTLRWAGRSVRISELAELLLVRAPHVTRQVGQLEARGLVERGRSADDHRVQLVGLTRRGRTSIDRFNESALQQMRETIADETPEDVRTAARIMEKLAAGAGEQPPSVRP